MRTCLKSEDILVDLHFKGHVQQKKISADVCFIKGGRFGKLLLFVKYEDVFTSPDFLKLYF